MPTITIPTTRWTSSDTGSINSNYDGNTGWGWGQWTTTLYSGSVKFRTDITAQLPECSGSVQLYLPIYCYASTSSTSNVTPSGSWGYGSQQYTIAARFVDAVGNVLGSAADYLNGSDHRTQVPIRLDLQSSVSASQIYLEVEVPRYRVNTSVYCRVNLSNVQITYTTSTSMPTAQTINWNGTGDTTTTNTYYVTDSNYRSLTQSVSGGCPSDYTYTQQGMLMPDSTGIGNKTGPSTTWNFSYPISWARYFQILCMAENVYGEAPRRYVNIKRGAAPSFYSNSLPYTTLYTPGQTATMVIEFTFWGGAGTFTYTNTDASVMQIVSSSSSIDTTNSRQLITFNVKFLKVGTSTIRVTSVDQSYGLSTQSQSFTYMVSNMPVAEFTITPTSGQTGDTFTTDNTSHAPSGDITYEWTINGFDVVYPSEDWTVSTPDNYKNLVIVFNEGGRYNIMLRVTSESGEQMTQTKTVTVKKPYVQTDSASTRYKILLRNGNYVTLLTRESMTNTANFTRLKFSDVLDGIGKSTFTVLNTQKAANSNVLLQAGTYVAILDNYLPIWYGQITAIAPVNNNFYSNSAEVRMYNVACESAASIMNTEFIESDVTGDYSGTAGLNTVGKVAISPLIIGEGNVGYIETDDSEVAALSINRTSRYTALSNLSKQTGWSIRTKPNVVVAYSDCVRNSDVSYTTEDAPDMSELDTFFAWNPDPDHPRIIVGIITAISANQVTINKLYESNQDPISNDMKCFSMRTWACDYASTFYQSEPVISLTTNNTARSVTGVEDVANTYGAISVYSTGTDREYKASTMSMWYKVNADYSIPGAAYITRSCDSLIHSAYIDTNQYPTIVVYGWAIPDPHSDDGYWDVFEPFVYTKTSIIDNNKYYILHGPNTYITKYTDSNGIRFTRISIHNINDGMKTAINNGDIQPGDYVLGIRYYISDVGAWVADNEDAQIGDEFYEDVGVLRANGYISLPDAAGKMGRHTYGRHGHLSGTIVLPTSASRSPTRPETGSPADLYPNITKSIQGPVNSSVMELERICSNYIRFGSNYTEKTSFEAGIRDLIKTEMLWERMIEVGDHIEIDSPQYPIKDLCVRSIEVDADAMNVKVQAGMPDVDLLDIIANTRDGQYTSITQVDI